MRRRQLLSLCAAVVLVANGALGAEVSVRGGVAAALPLTPPQTSYFGPGFGLNAALQLGLARWFDVGADLTYVFVSRQASSPLGGPGSALWLGAVVRAHLPFEGAVFTPFLELGFAYARTGTLDRPGLKAAAGAFFFAGPLRIGPRVELQQIFRITDEPGFATRDGTFLTVGAAVEVPVWRSVERGEAPEAPATPPPAPPPVAQSLDPDGDGLTGAADLCPDSGEDRDGFQDGDGCPEPDNDQDGTPDLGDDCPDQPGPSALHGCPDSDGDQVPDRVDWCPKVAGSAADGGCPVYKEVRNTQERIEILQKILFASGKATILPKSFGLLDEVARAVKDRDVCLVIGGHTDAVGDLMQNMSLSDGRAAAVREALVKRGVAGDRLVSKGFGPTQPIDDNKTADGREKNRRVEFVIAPCLPRASPTSPKG